MNVKPLYELKKEFMDWFYQTKPDYKYPVPLFGMAFYCTRHEIGVTLDQLFTGEVTLDEYADILYKLFKSMNSKNPYGRMSAYKDAMKNLLQFVTEYNYQNTHIIY